MSDLAKATQNFELAKRMYIVAKRKLHAAIIAAEREAELARTRVIVADAEIENEGTLGQRIRQARFDMKMNQYELTERVFPGASGASQISRYERSVGYPNLEILKRICEVLGLDYEKMRELRAAERNLRGMNPRS